MKVCTCVILFGIFAYTNSATRDRTKARISVKPANENVSELKNEEYSGHIMILENIQKPNAIETTASVKRKKRVFRVAAETLTGFIQDAVNILNTYEDTAFEDFFHILDTEIRKYHYRYCRFSELMQNQDTRFFLSRGLKMVREESVSSTKANINRIANMIREETYGNDVKKILDYINSLYTNTEWKFRRVLQELTHYRKMKSIKVHQKLMKVIRRGVRDIFFEHYTELDDNTRRELKVRIEKFWKRYKNNPASSAEVNDIHKMNDAVSEPVVSSISVSENVMNEDKDPENYSKTDSLTDMRNKRGSKSKKKYNQQPQDEETEKGDSSNVFEKWNSDTDTPVENSSGQSFDSSSNSIKESQERHAEYNVERYMTLYTEQISYKSRTTKKTEIKPISANEITKNATVPSLPKTTSTPRNSSENEQNNTKKVEVLSTGQDFNQTKQDMSKPEHDTESILMAKSKPSQRARQDDVKQQKHGKSKSKSKHKNTHFIGEYNAVIDVKLANTELLKSLRVLQPLLDSNSRYDTIKRSVLQTKSVPTKPRKMRARPETKSMKPALTQPPSRRSKTQESFYPNRLSNTRRNKLTILPEDGDFIRKLKQKYLTRHNANNTDLNVPKNFNEYVIQRLDNLEQDFKEFRSMLYDNHTEISNVTDKFEAQNKTENKRKDMRHNVVSLTSNKEENNDRQSTKSNILNTESSTNNTSGKEKNTLNTAVIDNKNTSQVTSNNDNNNKEFNKDKIDNIETTVTVNVSVKVTNSTEYEPFETTPKPTPADYSDIMHQLDHINDGLDLRM